MSGSSLYTHGKVYSLDELIRVQSGNADLRPATSDLEAYVLFEVSVMMVGVGDKLAQDLAGFRAASESDLRALYLVDPTGGETPDTCPFAWTPPLVKAEALRRLARDFREEAPSALAICRTVRENPYLPDLLRSDVEEQSFFGRPYYADVALGDWMRFIARNLEQLARKLEYYASKGETSICFEWNP